MKGSHGSVRHRLGYSGTTIVGILVLVTLAAPGASIAQRAPDIPMQFKIRGEFYDPQRDREKGGVNSFTANVESRQWILDIERADTLQGSMLGSSVLKRIYPPILTFVGPKELTEQLANPDILGKSYTMTGQLYVKKRMFKLDSLESNEEEGAGETVPGLQGESGPAPPAPTSPAPPIHVESSP